MKTNTITATIILITAFYGAACSAAEITGRASVIDGDTIEVHDTRIRLHGIDAPESDQTCSKLGQKYRCGQQAALTLDDLISGTVKCTQRDTDRYGRVVAECFSNNINLNAAMVKAGWALAYREYSNDYVVDETYAQQNNLGMWSGEFQAPWDYRRSPTSEEINQSEGCLIKGNINSEGRKIYHLPGTTAYGRTRIDENSGERWFCSEADAVDAGWAPVRS
jgi:endonuclease YncB( thermonuclease family)